MKQRSKAVGIIGIALVVIFLAVAIVADVLCVTYASLINLFFRASADAEEVIEQSNEFTVEQEAGGMVLMKNENDTLPLSKTTDARINLFGACSVKQLYLGTGSAGGWNWDESDFLNLKDALAEENVSVNEDLWNFYSRLTGSAAEAIGGVTDMAGMTHSLIEPPMSKYTETDADLLDDAKAYSDTAVVVIARCGGEGSDAVMDMNPYTMNYGFFGSYEMNVNGDAGKHYLELQDVEIELIDYVKANYKNVVILVNTPMPIELGFTDDDGIDSVLWIGMPGSTGNRAVADVLYGNVSPSGRLADTWAYEVESAPSYYNTGDFTYTDTDGNAGLSGSLKYLHYQENIYVGYRWYETANAEQVKLQGIGNYHWGNTAYQYGAVNENATGVNDRLVGAEQKDFDFTDYYGVVQYPFGYGLSYADFDIAWAETPAYNAADNTFTFRVTVTNTSSSASARTPVELYCEQPYDPAEGIEKSKVVLVGFAKTGELAPGASETLEITVNRDELASYDYKTEKAYVLSAGDYKFYADWGKYGSHCWAMTADTADVLSWTYSGIRDKVVFTDAQDGKRDSDVTEAVNRFEDVNIGDGAYVPARDDLTRADFEGTFPKSYAASLAMSEVDAQTVARMTDDMQGAVLQGYDPETYSYTGEYADENGHYRDPDGYTALQTGQANGLVCTDLTGVAYDDARWDQLIAQMSMADLYKITGYCGWQTPAIRSIGKTASVDMDGAEGLHDLVTGIEANCFAIAPITASSFDVELAYKMGDVYAQEALANGVTAIYGFSMNTHRSPFGGRAFEYYSEDGLLAGYIASAATSGLQDNGVTVFSKHYALNDQEKNRTSAHTWASEQAMREIYLRPFEIVTKTATHSSSLISGGTGFMTGYNYIGTSHTTAHYSLVTAVPRGEWGFQGRIITDAESYDSISCAIRAGTDMMLVPSQVQYDTDIPGIDNTQGYGLAKIQEAAKHQLFIYVNSAAIGTDSSLTSAWIAIPIALTVVLVAGCVLVTVFMIVPAFRRKKKED